MLARLTDLATKFPRAILACWLALISVLAIIGIGTNRHVPFANVRLAGTESARELALSQATFGRTATVPILLEGRRGRIGREGPRLVARLRSDPANHVLSPFDHVAAGAALRPHGGSALVVVVRSLRGSQQPADALAPIRAAAHAQSLGLRVSVTGPVAVAERLNEISLTSAARAQLLALPLLLLVLMLLFRSPLAALVPAIIGGATVAAGTGLVRLGVDLGAQFDVFAPTIASIMGLALGVDYSLLIVTRFRELLAAGEQDAAGAAAQTVMTAGRTVAHAGIVLAAGMICALLLAPGASLTSMAFAVLATTAVACLSALVAVPAALALLGHRIDRWTLGPAPRFGSFRIARRVLSRPRHAGAACLLPLVALAAVGLSITAGPPTVMQLSKQEPTRAAIERLRSSFGVGWEAPLEITLVAHSGPATAPATLARLVSLQHRLARLPGVHLVVGPADLASGLRGKRGRGGALRAIANAGSARRNAASVLVDLAHGATATRLFVIPAARWGSLGLARLREAIIGQLRALEAGGGIRAAVGGVAAETVEYDAIVSGRLPLLFAALAITSLTILAVLLRTLLVPLVTVALNTITVAATFGVLSLLFVGAHPLFGGPGEIDTMALTMMLVVIFALSIDYQVFLLGRMREHLPTAARPSRCAARLAIGEGLITTGPVVAGAALIMCTVFGAFATAQSIFLRQLGVGLTVAIAIDATIVRMVLLPSALAIIGRDAWKTPTWPRVSLRPSPTPGRSLQESAEV
ncbi:MAG: MMPL family transporter [Solirubrobacteraceae bacterium]